MQLLIYRRWSNWFACFPSDWPGCVATDCGWPAPASSAASQRPWLCAAPSEASGCSRQRPSGWCLCSSASRCQCRNTGKRGKRDGKPWVPERMFTVKKDKIPLIWLEKVHKCIMTYGSLDLGIRVPSSFIRSFMLNLRLRSTADTQTGKG